MATKKPFIARHGLNIGTTVVFGSNGKLHANNVISDGTITDTMLSGSTGSNLSKVQQVESNLLATNTAIRSLVTSNDTDISNLQSEDSSLWSAITATNTAIRSLVTSNDSDISANATKISQVESNLLASNTAIRSYVDTEVAGLVDSAPAALNTLNELAAALGDDANFATTVSTNIGQKLGATATVTLTGDVTASATAFSANAVSLSTNIASNVVGASELNVTGNGTSSQFLRSDGDGTFTWATPTDTNTTYSAGSGLDLSGTTFSVEADLRDGITHVGRDSNDYWACNTTSHDWYLDGVLDMRLENDGDLHVDGDVIAYSTTTSSDRKLKDDITNVENAIDKVKQLNGVEFTWKESGKKSAGVIAQDVEAVLPQAVKEVNDLNGDDTHKTVNYDSLHAILIEAIKEQQKQIEELLEKLK